MYEFLGFKANLPFLMSARSGFLRFYNALANKKPARIAHHNTLTVLCTRFIAESPNSAQVKDSKNQIHTIHSYIALRKYTLP